MMGSSAGSGSGSCSGYLDPQRVYELVIRRRPSELLDYLYEVPGASRDLHWEGVSLVGRALLLLNSVSQESGLSSREDDRQILSWAALARFHASNGIFLAPQMVGNPSDFTSDAGHHTHPHNSRSYSGRMLTHEPDSIELTYAAVHSTLTGSNSRIHTATVPPLRGNPSDVHRRTSSNNQEYASNSRVEPALPPLQPNTRVSAASEGSGGAPPLQKTMSQPSRAATSSPPPAPLRRRNPLRNCNRRILPVLPVPRPQVEEERVDLTQSDPESSAKRFDWAKAAKSWSDDDE